MAITGNISEFSLPEIFRFLEHQQGTGLLSIHEPAANSSQDRKSYYLWLREGRLVAVADRLDNQGLISLVSRRGWLKSEEIRQIVNRCPSAISTPLGVSLESQGALSAEQLKLLFYVQVLLKVCALFKLKDGQFVFDTTATLPCDEMTGLSLSMVEVTLLGLRVLRDWTSLAAKLPDSSAVMCKSSGQPHLQLDSQEGQIWELVDGKISINAIAIKLKLTSRTVQQIACRLSMVGLVQEIPIVSPTVTETISAAKSAPVRVSVDLQAIAKSFVQNLISKLENTTSWTSETSDRKSKVISQNIELLATADS